MDNPYKTPEEKREAARLKFARRRKEHPKNTLRKAAAYLERFL